MAGFTAVYRAFAERAGCGCPIEAGLIGSLADNECPHGHLPGDSRITCGCWRPKTPDLMTALKEAASAASLVPVSRETPVSPVKVVQDEPAMASEQINGWCPECRLWSVRGRQGQCMWCDTPLLEAEPTRPGKPVGKFLTKITEELLEEAYRMYREERNERGKPLSVRAVAALIYERTGYASVATCAQSLFDAFRARGWKLRDRIEASAEASTRHGRLAGAKDWRDPKAKRARAAYKATRRRRKRCAGLKVQAPGKGSPCRSWALKDSDYCRGHDLRFAEQRAADLAEARSRIDTHEKEVVRHGPWSDGEGHDVQRPRDPVARPGRGAQARAA